MGKRQANLLIFKLSLETLNDMLSRIVEGAKVLPKDIQIFKMGDMPGHMNGHWLMMESKTFPLVKEGKQVKEGHVEFITSDYGSQLTFIGEIDVKQKANKKDNITV